MLSKSQKYFNITVKNINLMAKTNKNLRYTSEGIPYHTTSFSRTANTLGGAGRGVDLGEELTTFENFKAFPRAISFQNAILRKVQVADGWGRLLEL